MSKTETKTKTKTKTNKEKDRIDALEVKQEDKLPPSGGNSSEKEYRGRRFVLTLYPDNYYQQKFLDYLVAVGKDMCYILHDRTPGQKPHYHVLIHFDTPRTCSSIRSAAGQAPYYKEGDKLIAYIPGVSPVSRITECEMLDILPYTGIEGDDFVEPCRCVEDTVLYFLHLTFKAQMQGKEAYDFSELRYSGAGRAMFEKYTRGSETYDEQRICSEIVELYDDYGGNAEVIRAALGMGRMDIVEYVRKHPTFVNCFLSKNYCSRSDDEDSERR